MIVQLKLFDFDLNTVERKNTNSYFQFPLEAVFTPVSKNPCERYHLVGIVIHSGSAMSGHYAYAKSQEDRK